MKVLKYFLASLLIVCLAACNEGIDPITPVAPGPDETPPAVKINYPSEGTLIRVKEDVTSVNIEIEVVDDIEIESITLSLDNAEIAKFTEFKDYRRVVKEYLYGQVTNGMHTLSVNVKDLSGKAASASVKFEKAAPYKPVYDNEIFYMPFDGNLIELVSITYATRVGTPGFNDAGKIGKAYAGVFDGYLLFPVQDKDINLLNPEFSAVFWYKLNASPDRAGILVIGPEDEANPTAMNKRTSGFRFFREANATKQTFKLNAGSGAADSWFDGGDAASLDSENTEWVHMAFTISDAKCVVYINGEVVKEDAFTGIDWTGCTVMSIGSGAPRFTGWNHNSDYSLIDELRIFNKALSQQEIRTIMNAEK